MATQTRADIDARIADAREDGTLSTWRIEAIGGRWLVYRETNNGVAAYSCGMTGMTAVAHSAFGLVRGTSATTYRSKSAAVAAVRRGEDEYTTVAVRGDTIYVF